MNESLSAAIAAELRVEIAVQDVSVRDLARDTGLVERSVHRWLKGQREINIDVLEKLADALAVPVSELMRRAEVRAGKVSPESGGTFRQYPSV